MTEDEMTTALRRLAGFIAAKYGLRQGTIGFDLAMRCVAILNEVKATPDAEAAIAALELLANIHGLYQIEKQRIATASAMRN